LSGKISFPLKKISFLKTLHLTECFKKEFCKCQSPCLKVNTTVILKPPEVVEVRVIMTSYRDLDPISRYLTWQKGPCRCDELRMWHGDNALDCLGEQSNYTSAWKQRAFPCVVRGKPADWENGVRPHSWPGTVGALRRWKTQGNGFFPKAVPKNGPHLCSCLDFIPGDLCQTSDPLNYK
jgi:hypothetical protein